MQVKEIMSCGVKSIAPDTKLVEVASLMCLYRYCGLPVVEDGKLVGLIAEKDVLHRLFPSLEDLMEAGGMAGVDLDKMMSQYKEVLTLKAEDLMARNVITVSPDMHILRAATVMVRQGVGQERRGIIIFALVLLGCTAFGFLIVGIRVTRLLLS